MIDERKRERERDTAIDTLALSDMFHEVSKQRCDCDIFSGFFLSLLFICK